MKELQMCVGIDLARRSEHKAVVVRRDGSAPKKAFAFSHDLDGFRSLCDYIGRQTGTGSVEGVTVNFEPTGGVWETLGLFLKKQGADVYFTRPDVVSQMRKVHSRFAKSDRIDAYALARIAFSFPDRLIPLVEIESRVRALRSLSAQRRRIVDNTSQWKNRLTSKLEVVWATMLAKLDKDQRFCGLARAFFVKFVDPRSVTRYGRQRFYTWCGKTAHGNTDPQLFDTLWHGACKVAALWKELESSGAMHVDWETLGEMIKQDLRMIESFEKEINLLDQRIREARRQTPECDVVQQLPGFGNVVSVTVASTLMPVERFGNSKKCGAFTGYTSRQKASAGRQIDGLKITKTGNCRLKRDLALAADRAMRCDPELAAFAIRLLNAGKHYNKVRVAVGRKLAERAYSLLKRFARSETHVRYIWRDLQGHSVTKKEAADIARKLWADYNARKKQKGNPPTAA